MEKITPFLILLILFPVSIVGGILNLFYYPVKFMRNPIDWKGAREGFYYAVEKDKEFWSYLKTYMTNLFGKIKRDS